MSIGRGWAPENEKTEFDIEVEIILKGILDDVFNKIKNNTNGVTFGFKARYPEKYYI